MDSNRLLQNINRRSSPLNQEPSPNVASTSYKGKHRRRWKRKRSESSTNGVSRLRVNGSLNRGVSRKLSEPCPPFGLPSVTFSSQQPLRVFPALQAQVPQSHPHFEAVPTHTTNGTSFIPTRPAFMGPAIKSAQEQQYSAAGVFSLATARQAPQEEIVDLEQFSNVVGYFASVAPLQNEHYIPLQNIDWTSVASYYSDITPQTAMALWTKYFSGYSFARVGDSVLMYCREFPVRTTPSSSVGSDSEDKSILRRQKKAPWEPEEEKLIAELQKELGNKWTVIAERMGTNRSGTDVKNYWHNKRHKIALDLLKKKDHSQKPE